MAGVHAGRVLTQQLSARGLLRGNFEYAVEVFPYWQSFTPKFQRVSCVAGDAATCDHLFAAVHRRRDIPRRQHYADHPALELRAARQDSALGAGRRRGALDESQVSRLRRHHRQPDHQWTERRSQRVELYAAGRRRRCTTSRGQNRSIDFSANAVHISSASLGDRNPGVNASVQFSVGYTWWK